MKSQLHRASRWARIAAQATLLVLLVASLLPVTASVQAAQPEMLKTKRVITVEALIDGRSQLILSGRTATWLHLDFAAPGRWMGKDEPTIINGKEWYPSWPDQPDKENRFCNCYSSTYTGIKPALPKTDMSVSVKVLQGRGQVRVIQADSGKNKTVVIEFDDDPFSEPSMYKVELSVSFGG